MASEQARTRKKSRGASKEDRNHPVLFRHQDCIPNSNCDVHQFSNLRSDSGSSCPSKLANEPEINKVKNVNKKLNLKTNKNCESLEKSELESKTNAEHSNGVVGNSEELSKSRKRRLRKRRLLVALAPTLSNNNKPPSPSVENKQQPKSITRPLANSSNIVPAVSTTSTRTAEPIKTPIKDSRKRIEKNISSRNKNIKIKSSIDISNQPKPGVIKTFEEKTLNTLLQTLVPLTNSSPKKDKPVLPFFSFSEKRLSSSDTKVDEDGVFYFGETKHHLEKLSPSFKTYNTCSPEKIETVPYTESNGNCISSSKLRNLENFATTNNIASFGPGNQSDLCTLNNKILDSETVIFDNIIDNSRPLPIESCIHSPQSFAFKPSTVNTFNDVLFSSVTSMDSNDLIKYENIDLGSTELPTSKAISLEKSGNSLSMASISSEGAKIEVNNTMEEMKNKLLKMRPADEGCKPQKTREEIILEREAKKAAKLAAKSKLKCGKVGKSEVSNNDQVDRNNKNDSKSNVENNISRVELEVNVSVNNVMDKSNIQVTKDVVGSQTANDLEITPSPQQSQQDQSSKSKAELRAERRAKQEAQRAAKAAGKTAQPQPKQTKDKISHPPPTEQTKTTNQTEKKTEVVLKIYSQPKPKLFSHLYQEKSSLFSDHRFKVTSLHPAVIRLGKQYESRVVSGSNARCVALLHALKQMVTDYITPSEKEFSRGLEEEFGPVMAYLNQCRPVAVSMTNAVRHIKRTLTQLPNTITDIEARRKVCDVIDTYIHEQVDMAGKQICDTVKKKIANGDVILVYGCSSLLYQILVESHINGTKFRVVIVDGMPWREGREMLRRLVDKGLSCTYVLITAASFIMREATKVLLGAHALLANGYVMSRAGSSQVALLAHCYNVPVLVCCETHKFCERVQTDAFVYNEIGELSCNQIKDKEKSRMLTPLSLAYDITPPDLVSAVVTELAVLPCTSVPVILRIKPSESVM